MEGGNNLISLSILDKADSSRLEFMTQRFVNRHWNRGQGKWDFHQGDLQNGLKGEAIFCCKWFLYMYVYIYTPQILFWGNVWIEF